MVCIGRVLRTRGNKGELVVDLSPPGVAPQEGSAVELRSGKRVYPQIVERVTIVGGDLVVVVSGAKTIGEALRYVGCAVWADAPAPGVDGGANVIGFEIFDRQGEYWGRVKAEPRFSLNQILEIEDEGGGIVYVPWHEKLIVKIDRRRRVVVIDPPEGLRDLNK